MSATLSPPFSGDAAVPSPSRPSSSSAKLSSSASVIGSSTVVDRGRGGEGQGGIAGEAPTSSPSPSKSLRPGGGDREEEQGHLPPSYYPSIHNNLPVSSSSASPLSVTSPTTVFLHQGGSSPSTVKSSSSRLQNQGGSGEGGFLVSSLDRDRLENLSMASTKKDTPDHPCLTTLSSSGDPSTSSSTGSEQIHLSGEGGVSSSSSTASPSSPVWYSRMSSAGVAASSHTRTIPSARAHSSSPSSPPLTPSTSSNSSPPHNISRAFPSSPSSSPPPPPPAPPPPSAPLPLLSSSCTPCHLSQSTSSSSPLSSSSSLPGRVPLQHPRLSCHRHSNNLPPPSSPSPPQLPPLPSHPHHGEEQPPRQDSLNVSSSSSESCSTSPSTSLSSSSVAIVSSSSVFPPSSSCWSLGSLLLSSVSSSGGRGDRRQEPSGWGCQLSSFLTYNDLARLRACSKDLKCFVESEGIVEACKCVILKRRWWAAWTSSLVSGGGGGGGMNQNSSHSSPHQHHHHTSHTTAANAMATPGLHSSLLLLHPYQSPNTPPPPPTPHNGSTITTTMTPQSTMGTPSPLPSGAAAPAGGGGSLLSSSSSSPPGGTSSHNTKSSMMVTPHPHHANPNLLLLNAPSNHTPLHNTPHSTASSSSTSSSSSQPTTTTTTSSMMNHHHGSYSATSAPSSGSAIGNMSVRTEGLCSSGALPPVSSSSVSSLLFSPASSIAVSGSLSLASSPSPPPLASPPPVAMSPQFSWRKIITCPSRSKPVSPPTPTSSGSSSFSPPSSSSLDEVIFHMEGAQAMSDVKAVVELLSRTALDLKKLSIHSDPFPDPLHRGGPSSASAFRALPAQPISAFSLERTQGRETIGGGGGEGGGGGRRTTTSSSEEGPCGPPRGAEGDGESCTGSFSSSSSSFFSREREGENHGVLECPSSAFSSSYYDVIIGFPKLESLTLSGTWSIYWLVAITGCQFYQAGSGPGATNTTTTTTSSNSTGGSHQAAHPGRLYAQMTRGVVLPSCKSLELIISDPAVALNFGHVERKDSSSSSSSFSSFFKTAGGAGVGGGNPGFTPTLFTARATGAVVVASSSPCPPAVPPQSSPPFYYPPFQVFQQQAQQPLSSSSTPTAVGVHPRLLPQTNLTTYWGTGSSGSSSSSVAPPSSFSSCFSLSSSSLSTSSRRAVGSPTGVGDGGLLRGVSPVSTGGEVGGTGRRSSSSSLAQTSSSSPYCYASSLEHQHNSTSSQQQEEGSSGRGREEEKNAGGGGESRGEAFKEPRQEEGEFHMNESDASQGNPPLGRLALFPCSSGEGRRGTDGRGDLSGMVIAGNDQAAGIAPGGMKMTNHKKDNRMEIIPGSISTTTGGGGGGGGCGLLQPLEKMTCEESKAASSQSSSSSSNCQGPLIRRHQANEDLYHPSPPSHNSHGNSDSLMNSPPTQVLLNSNPTGAMEGGGITGLGSTLPMMPQETGTASILSGRRGEETRSSTREGEDRDEGEPQKNSLHPHPSHLLRSSTDPPLSSPSSSHSITSSQPEQPISAMTGKTMMPGVSIPQGEKEDDLHAESQKRGEAMNIGRRSTNLSSSSGYPVYEYCYESFPGLTALASLQSSHHFDFLLYTDHVFASFPNLERLLLDTRGGGSSLLFQQCKTSDFLSQLIYPSSSLFHDGGGSKLDPMATPTPALNSFSSSSSSLTPVIKTAILWWRIILRRCRRLKEVIIAGDDADLFYAFEYARLEELSSASIPTVRKKESHIKMEDEGHEGKDRRTRRHHDASSSYPGLHSHSSSSMGVTLSTTQRREEVHEGSCLYTDTGRTRGRRKSAGRGGGEERDREETERNQDERRKDSRTTSSIVDGRTSSSRMIPARTGGGEPKSMDEERERKGGRDEERKEAKMASNKNRREGGEQEEERKGRADVNVEVRLKRERDGAEDREELSHHIRKGEERISREEEESHELSKRLHYGVSNGVIDRGQGRSKEEKQENSERDNRDESGNVARENSSSPSSLVSSSSSSSLVLPMNDYPHVSKETVDVGIHRGGGGGRRRADEEEEESRGEKRGRKKHEGEAGVEEQQREGGIPEERERREDSLKKRKTYENAEGKTIKSETRRTPPYVSGSEEEMEERETMTTTWVSPLSLRHVTAVGKGGGSGTLSSFACLFEDEHLVTYLLNSVSESQERREGVDFHWSCGIRLTARMLLEADSLVDMMRKAIMLDDDLDLCSSSLLSSSSSVTSAAQREGVKRRRKGCVSLRGNRSEEREKDHHDDEGEEEEREDNERHTEEAEGGGGEEQVKRGLCMHDERRKRVGRRDEEKRYEEEKKTRKQRFLLPLFLPSSFACLSGGGEASLDGEEEDVCVIENGGLFYHRWIRRLCLDSCTWTIVVSTHPGQERCNEMYRFYFEDLEKKKKEAKGRMSEHINSSLSFSHTCRRTKKRSSLNFLSSPLPPSSTIFDPHSGSSSLSPHVSSEHPAAYLSSLSQHQDRDNQASSPSHSVCLSKTNQSIASLLSSSSSLSAACRDDLHRGIGEREKGRGEEKEREDVGAADQEEEEAHQQNREKGDKKKKEGEQEERNVRDSHDHSRHSKNHGEKERGGGKEEEEEDRHVYRRQQEEREEGCCHTSYHVSSEPHSSDGIRQEIAGDILISSPSPRSSLHNPEAGKRGKEEKEEKAGVVSPAGATEPEDEGGDNANVRTSVPYTCEEESTSSSASLSSSSLHKDLDRRDTYPAALVGERQEEGKKETASSLFVSSPRFSSSSHSSSCDTGVPSLFSPGVSKEKREGRGGLCRQRIQEKRSRREDANRCMATSSSSFSSSFFLPSVQFITPGGRRVADVVRQDCIPVLRSLVPLSSSVSPFPSRPTMGYHTNLSRRRKEEERGGGGEEERRNGKSLTTTKVPGREEEEEGDRDEDDHVFDKKGEASSIKMRKEKRGGRKRDAIIQESRERKDDRQISSEDNPWNGLYSSSHVNGLPHPSRTASDGRCAVDLLSMHCSTLPASSFFHGDKKKTSPPFSSSFSSSSRTPFSSSRHHKDSARPCGFILSACPFAGACFTRPWDFERELLMTVCSDSSLRASFLGIEVLVRLSTLDGSLEIQGGNLMRCLVSIKKNRDAYLKRRKEKGGEERVRNRCVSSSSSCCSSSGRNCEASSRLSVQEREKEEKKKKGYDRRERQQEENEERGRRMRERTTSDEIGRDGEEGDADMTRRRKGQTQEIHDNGPSSSSSLLMSLRDDSHWNNSSRMRSPTTKTKIAAETRHEWHHRFLFSLPGADSYSLKNRCEGDLDSMLIDHHKKNNGFFIEGEERDRADDDDDSDFLTSFLFFPPNIRLPPMLRVLRITIGSELPGESVVGGERVGDEEFRHLFHDFLLHYQSCLRFVEVEVTHLLLREEDSRLVHLHWALAMKRTHAALIDGGFQKRACYMGATPKDFIHVYERTYQE